jgi:hypothetical protein
MRVYSVYLFSKWSVLTNSCEKTLIFIKISAADPDHFQSDPDPAFHFDTDPDANRAFQFDTDLDPTVLYGSGSLPFHKGNVPVPKTVLFIHIILIMCVKNLYLV